MSFVEFDPAPENQRRSIDPAIEVIVHKMTRMATDMDKLTSSIEAMSQSMSRLVLAEERINQVMSSIERVHKRLDEGQGRFKAVEDRIVELEKESIAFSKSSMWIDRGIIGIVSVVLGYVAHKLGLM